MKKCTFPIFCDTLFLFICSAFFCFIVSRFYLSPLVSLALSVAVGGLTCLLFLRRKSRAYQGAVIKKTEEAECKKLLDTLPVLFGKARDTIKTVLSSAVDCPTVFYFRFQPMSKDQAALLLRASHHPVHLYATALSEEARTLLFHTDVAVTEGAGIYRTLKDQNALPPLPQTRKRRGAKEILRVFFRKKNAVRYLAYGVLLLGMSMVVPFPIYYVACGGLFLSYAVVARFWGKPD